MQPGKTKSRSFRRVFKRVISKTKVFYEQRKPSAAKCADCGVKLQGVPRLTANKAKNTPKTHKRPERPYGGELCSKCTRIRIKENIKK
ncbi:MAG: 50S ribosomal protein L34e [Nanoarchaeota archaeon]|nr:50S ribosomal protein L34e [Nanoarchaeota archaeon]